MGEAFFHILNKVVICNVADTGRNCKHHLDCSVSVDWGTATMYNTKDVNHSIDSRLNAHFKSNSMFCIDCGNRKLF